MKAAPSRSSPVIAKKLTGNLDEVAIAAIQEKTAYFREMEDRRATILSSIAEQGKLTDELKLKIQSRSRSQSAGRSLSSLQAKAPHQSNHRSRKRPRTARRIHLQSSPRKQTLLELAAALVNPEKQVNTPEEALEGARHILAEQFSENAEFRAYLRQLDAR